MPDAAEALHAALPPDVRARAQSARLAGGVATVVLNVAGTDREALRAMPGVREVRVAMTADKPPAPRIVAIGSGKGGVGKSTLSTNIAVALARMGHKVGLVDADIYGPSQPRLLGNEGMRPEARDDKLVPVPSRWGVTVLSMGHLIAPGRAMAWRGPMAGKALSQLIDADWGDVETLIVDLPPGTGDVQLTMLQRYKPVGAVIVSTPQDLALIDAARALQLFEQGNVPVIGMVENMAGYVCPHCGEASDPFGRGGAEAAATAMGQAFLGRIPLDLTIRQDSDAGTPPAAGDTPQGAAFAAIARRIAEWLDRA